MAPRVRLIGLAPRDPQLGKRNPGGLPDTHPAYPYNVLAYWPALSYQMAEEVAKLLRCLPPPDLIESQEYAALPYFLLQRKLTERTPLEQVPILVHQHGPYFELARVNQEPRYRLPEYWVGQMEKFCLVSADALLSPSYYLARCAKETLQLSTEITRIPYPFVLPDDMAPRKGQPGHLVYVGRLEVRKGVLPLVEACSGLWATGEDFRLTLIGGDVDFFPQGVTVGAFIRRRYKRWMESGHLKLVGQLEHAAVLECVRHAWAVVVPSLWENFPHTCMEAMGIGQVVLASRSGGQAEMIQTEGVDGFLFDWHVPGDFEQKLRRVLTLGEGERSEIARQAQERIQALCAPEVILPQRMRHYEAVIAHHQPLRLFPTVHRSPISRLGELENTARPVTLEREEADLVSVILPYCNPRTLLRDTCESILASTHAPVEILVVHDDSTEQKSLEVLEEFEGRGASTLRLIRAEDPGVAVARKTGLERASGEFVAFMDADDVVEPEFFERAITVLRRYPNVVLVYSWVRSLGPSSALWPTWNAEFPALLGRTMWTRPAVVRRSAFVSWRQREPRRECNFADFEEWMIALVAAGGVGVSLPHPLASYRVRPGSMARRVERNQPWYRYEALTQRHAEAYREWGVELFHLQNANGPGYLWNPYASVDLDDISWRDYELGGRLVSRIRRMWLVRQALRYPGLKKALRKILER
jgi:glycosyltransferase involved in cell wall biosynthesis